MLAQDSKKKRAEKRRARVRGKVFGTTNKPRLTVARTLKNIYAQLVDDEKMVTLASSSSLTKEIFEKAKGKKKTEIASLVGSEIAKRALDKGIKNVAFDRNRSLYHGRVKALAEAARKAGLEF